MSSAVRVRMDTSGNLKLADESFDRVFVCAQPIQSQPTLLTLGARQDPQTPVRVSLNGNAQFCRVPIDQRNRSTQV